MTDAPEQLADHGVTSTVSRPLKAALGVSWSVCQRFRRTSSGTVDKLAGLAADRREGREGGRDDYEATVALKRSGRPTGP